MLPWEIFKMAMDTKPVGGLFHSQAKKRPWLPAVWRPWPPWRLIATHPNSKFPLTHSKHRTRQFLIATRIPFSIPYSSLSLFTLTPPRREGRGFNRALAPAVFRSSQQDVCETRPSRILTNALRPEQRTRRRAFTPPAARRMLARGSSSIIPGKEPIQANCGGSPCGFS